jgi:hypothetical protein
MLEHPARCVAASSAISRNVFARALGKLDQMRLTSCDWTIAHSRHATHSGSLIELNQSVRFMTPARSRDVADSYCSPAAAFPLSNATIDLVNEVRGADDLFSSKVLAAQKTLVPENSRSACLGVSLRRTRARSLLFHRYVSQKQ